MKELQHKNKKCEKNKNTEKTKTQPRTQQDANKKTNNRTRTKHEPEQITKRKKQDRIEPVSRAEALIPDDVNLTRSGLLGTGYGDLDDATSSKGR